MSETSPASAAGNEPRSIRLLAMLGSWFIRALHATLRVRHLHADRIDSTPQFILAFWHECGLMCLHSRWRRPIKAIISRSKDGSIMTALVGRYGAEAARGSSSRGGGSALREVLRDVRAGSNIALTPDGPKGPYRVVKEGTVFIAQASGLPVVPFHYTAERKKHLRSWDRHIVPMPFSRALFVYGEPIHVPRDGDPEEWRRVIETQMNTLAEEVERDFDTLWRAAPRRLPPVTHGSASAPRIKRETR